MNDSVEKWVDTHVHVGVEPECGIAELSAGLAEFFKQETVDLRFIASPGGEWLNMISDERNGGVMEAHRLLHQVIEGFPDKIYGSCMINPNFMDASLAVMDKCFGEWEFLQLGELLTYMMDFRMNSEPTVKLVRKAVEYDVPIHVHISTSNAKPQGHYSSGEEELEDMLDLAERVPEGKFVVAHGIGAPLIHPPVVDAYLNIIDGRYGKWPDNFWIEIMHFHAAGLKSALEYIPPSKIMAGMDWATSTGLPFPPYGTVFGPAEKKTPYPINIQSLVDFLVKAGANENAIHQIAYRNAFALYDLK